MTFKIYIPARYGATMIAADAAVACGAGVDTQSDLDLPRHA